MGTADASVRLHPIQVASRRSGLRPDVLRAWERRHGAVVPQRTASGRQLYSDEDVERLRMLGALTRAGHRFSDGAAHPESVLVQLLDPAGSGSSPSPATEGVPRVFSSVRSTPWRRWTAIRYADALDAIGAVHMDNLEDLRTLLREKSGRGGGKRRLRAGDPRRAPTVNARG